MTDNEVGREAGDPIVIWLFGQPKRSKSNTISRVRPGMLWFGVTKAIDLVSWGVDGYHAAVWPEAPETFDDLFRIMDGAGSSINDYSGWGVDDLTLICERSLTIWDENAPVSRRSGKKDIWAQYRELNKATGELVARARHAGVSLVGFNSHERESSFDDDGGFHAGGPEMGTKARAKKMPGWCDIMARAVSDNESPDPWLKTKLWVKPFHKDWVTGDRNDVCWDNTPPSLREILLASEYGFDLPRLPGLEWQEEVVEEVASKLAAMESPDPTAIAKAISASKDRWLRQDTRHPKWLRWAIQDGIARFRLRLRQQAGLFSDEAMGAASDDKKRRRPPPPPPKKPTAAKPATKPSNNKPSAPE